MRRAASRPNKCPISSTTAGFCTNNVRVANVVLSIIILITSSFVFSSRTIYTAKHRAEVVALAVAPSSASWEVHLPSNLVRHHVCLGLGLLFYPATPEPYCSYSARIFPRFSRSRIYARRLTAEDMPRLEEHEMEEAFIPGSHPSRRKKPAVGRVEETPTGTRQSTRIKTASIIKKAAAAAQANPSTRGTRQSAVKAQVRFEDQNRVVRN